MHVTEDAADWISGMHNAGADDSTILLILQQRGWSESDAVKALEAVYARLTGIETPLPSRVSKVRPRDAFLHLVLYGSLIGWTTALIVVLNYWIESMFPEAAVRRWDYYDVRAATDAVAYSVATVLVLLPIYLWAWRALKRDQQLDPDRLTSPVRFWITYGALFVGLVVIATKLSFALSELFKGELTIVTTLQSLALLVVVGGLMWFHHASLKPLAGPK